MSAATPCMRRPGNSFEILAVLRRRLILEGIVRADETLCYRHPTHPMQTIPPGPPDEPLKILFFVPYRHDGLTAVPSDSSHYWSWISRQASIGEGKYSWTLQTFLQLHDAGLDCALVHDFPDRGIVVSHRDFLPVFLLPRPDVFLVCIKPDRKAHPWAHHYVVQNARDSVARDPRWAAFTTTIPFWPQPSLLPRDETRRTTCDRVAYIGRELNLASQLRDGNAAQLLEPLGLEWVTPPLPQWNDYRDIDVTVSVRTFDSDRPNCDPVMAPDSKPPSKLVNSWLAGVPAIIGAESAYQNIRESDLDFLEVESVDEMVEALRRLRGDASLYRRMVQHGRRRAADYTVEAIRERWLRALREDVMRTRRRWQRRSRAHRVLEAVSGIARYFARPQNVRDVLASAGVLRRTT